MKWRALLLTIASLVGVDRARATTITITVTGVIRSGTDVGGMWGFSPGANLAGQNFTLVYLFNDDSGSGSANLNTNPSYIWTQNNTYPSPGTATLTINNVPYVFGTGSSPSSEAIIYTGGAYSSGTSDDPGVGTYLVSDSLDNVGSSVQPANVNTGLTWLAGTWETTVPTTAVTGGSTNGFNIQVDTQYTSNGSFTPQFLTVSGGPALCDIPAVENSVFHGWDTPQNAPNKALFWQTLQNSDNTATANEYTGANVYEYTPNPGDTDACYDQAKALGQPPSFPPFNQVSGGQVAVSANSTWQDLVGWGTDQISFYQNLQGMHFPCTASWTQSMKFQCYAGGGWYSYGGTNTGGANAISASINNSTSPTALTVIRSGVSSGNQQ